MNWSVFLSADIWCNTIIVCVYSYVCKSIFLAKYVQLFIIYICSHIHVLHMFTYIHIFIYACVRYVHCSFIHIFIYAHMFMCTYLHICTCYICSDLQVHVLAAKFACLCNHNLWSETAFVVDLKIVSVSQRCGIVCAVQSSVMAVADVRMPTESTAWGSFGRWIDSWVGCAEWSVAIELTHLSLSGDIRSDGNWCKMLLSFPTFIHSEYF